MKCLTLGEVKRALSGLDSYTNLHDSTTVAAVLMRPGIIGFDCYRKSEAGDHTRNYGDFSSLEVHKVKDLGILFSNLQEVTLHLPVFILLPEGDRRFVHLSHYHE